MRGVKEVRRENLAALVAKAGSQSQLADIVGTNRLYLSQILSSVTARDLGDRLARRIETAMGLPDGWMDSTHANAIEDSEQRRLLPELSDGQVIRLSAGDDVPPGGMLYPTGSVGPRSFVVRVGRQEVAQVPAGSAVVVDPDEPPRSDDIVLVASEAAGKVFLRKLDISITGQRRLIADTTGEVIDMPDGARIAGVVREVALRLR